MRCVDAVENDRYISDAAALHAVKYEWSFRLYDPLYICGILSFVHTDPLHRRWNTDVSIIFYHNSTQRTAPQVKMNTV